MRIKGSIFIFYYLHYCPNILRLGQDFLDRQQMTKTKVQNSFCEFGFYFLLEILITIQKRFQYKLLLNKCKEKKDHVVKIIVKNTFSNHSSIDKDQFNVAKIILEYNCTRWSYYIASYYNIKWVTQKFLIQTKYNDLRI